MIKRVGFGLLRHLIAIYLVDIIVGIDVNQDGGNDMRDALTLLKYLAG